LRALGTQLLAGRDPTPADMGPGRTIIVNQAFANRYFGGQNPVGRQVRSVFGSKDSSVIIGLARHQEYFGPRQESQPFYYMPSRYLGEDTFCIRTALRPEKMIPTIRRIVEQQAPGVAIIQLRTMEEQVGRRMDSEKQMAALAGIFGLLATVLAAIGLYGVMAYVVARRTREIGIRMALGAAPSKVMALVIREVGQIIGLGLLIGLPSGLALAHVIRSQLCSIAPTDPFSAAFAAIVVAGMALLAGLMPARRATRIAPMLALRWE
jgi:hypothetical protein